MTEPCAAGSTAPSLGAQTVSGIPSWTDLRAADDAFSKSMYLPKRRRLGPLELAWHPDLEDVEWNRLRMVTAPGDDLRLWLKRGLSALGTGCVEIGPADPPQLEASLAGWRFAPAFEHRWILLPVPPALPSLHGDSPDGMIIHPVSPRRREDFISTFHQGFSSDDRGHLGQGWDRALRRLLSTRSKAWKVSHPSPQLVHCIAYLAGEAAGVASLGVLGNLAGLYNLAVPPRFRHRGVANALMRHRLRLAGELGARTAFLQTDTDGVYRWHRRHGYLSGPVVRGWAPLIEPPEASQGGLCPAVEPSASDLSGSTFWASKAGTSIPKK